MNWTDERVDMLRKLWAEGFSASQIAAQLGQVTRNAVIGKVHRLKLSSRGRSTAAAVKPKKQATAARSTSRAASVARHVTTSIGATALATHFEVEPVVRYQSRPVENVVIPISRRLKLVELSDRTCKWPNGDPLTEDFSFCGADSVESGPYCTYHCRLAFQPPAERRRNR